VSSTTWSSRLGTGFSTLRHSERLGVIVALIALCVYLAWASPFFLTGSNILNIGTSIAIVGIVAAGSSIVMLGGGIDISIGSTVALAGIVGAQAMAAGYGPVAGVAVSVMAGAIAGLANGVLIAVLGVNPLIATLGTLSIYRGLAFVFSDGVAVGVSDPAFLAIGTGKTFGIPNPLLIMIVVFCLVGVLLKWTRVGRNVYAIGGNMDAARLAGINIRRYGIGLYVASGALSGVSAVVLTARLGSAQPLAAAGLELDAIAACVLGGISLAGGIGTIGGTVLGVLVLGVVNNGLNILQVDSFYQYVARGGVLLIAVALDQVNIKRRNRAQTGAQRRREVQQARQREPEEVR
jgi:ribose transport system permease protein